MSDFRTYEPKEFFEKLVRPTYDEYLADPLMHHRVKNAVAQLDIMAERSWHWWSKVDPQRIAFTGSPRAYRQYLVDTECPDYQFVWDIHDGHKHVELSRHNRKVTSSSQTGVAFVDGAFCADAFQQEAFDVGTGTFLVKLDDGSERELASILASVYEMWVRIAN
jgi:hypothetical protein